MKRAEGRTLIGQNSGLQKFVQAPSRGAGRTGLKQRAALDPHCNSIPNVSLVRTTISRSRLLSVSAGEGAACHRGQEIECTGTVSGRWVIEADQVDEGQTYQWRALLG